MIFVFFRRCDVCCIRGSCYIFFVLPDHDAVAVVNMKRAAIKMQTMPLRDWYVHIGSRLPYLDIIKYTNMYVAISRAALRANVMCLLTGKLGARSSSMLHAIVDVHLKSHQCCYLMHLKHYHY